MVSVRDVYRSVRVERGTPSTAHGSSHLSPPPRQLPVRRQALCSESAARSALERCRRALILVSLAHPTIHFTLQARSTEHAGDRVLLDAPKVSRRACDAGEFNVVMLKRDKASSLLQSYERHFGIPVSSPDSALLISASKRLRGTVVDMTGLVMLSLLPSRAHQHLLLNGRLEGDGVDIQSSLHGALQWGALQSAVLQVLHESTIGEHATTREHCGFFLNICYPGGDQIEVTQLQEALGELLRDVLHRNGLLSAETEHSHTIVHQTDEESPTKKQKSGSERKTAKTSGRQFVLDRSDLLREPRDEGDESGYSAWLQDILHLWRGMATSEESLESRIPATHGMALRRQRAPFTPTIQEEQSRILERRGLEVCRVIGQVDAKYICILYDGDLVVFVDQHAAHERVRLETCLSRYLSDSMQGCSTHTLRPAPQLLLLPSSLASAFDDEEVRSALHQWGFRIGAPQKSSSSGTQSISLEAVPEVLSERLFKGTQMLEVLFTKLAIALQDDDIRSRLLTPLSLSKDGNTSWAFTLRHLPPPVLDQFLSLACRGAISE